MFSKELARSNPIASMYGTFTYIWLMIFMVNVRKYTSPTDGTGITPCKFSSFYFTKGDGTQSFSSVKNLFSTFFLALETAFCPPCLLLV